MKLVRRITLILFATSALLVMTLFAIAAFHRPTFDPNKVHPTALEIGENNPDVWSRWYLDGGTVRIFARGASGKATVFCMPSGGHPAVSRDDLYVGYSYLDGDLVDESRFPDTRAYIYNMLEDSGSHDDWICSAQSRLFRPVPLPIRANLLLRRLFGKTKDERPVPYSGNVLHKKMEDGQWRYHEFWIDADGLITERWAEVGEKGAKREYGVPEGSHYSDVLNRVLKRVTDDGYGVLDFEDYSSLSIRFMGDGLDDFVDNQFEELRESVSKLLAETGLGYRGGTGSSTDWVEVYCCVIDYEKAKSVLEAEFDDAEYAKLMQIEP